VSGIGDLAIAAAAAFAASVLGGVAGYGVGMVIPIFLAPVVGIAGVVPTTTIATLFTGFGRLWAFRRALSWPEIRRMSALGLPMSFAGAWILTVLEPRQLALFLVSAILMATGLKGAALIGSIAAVGLSTHFPKIATFAATGLLDMRLLTVGIIVGIGSRAATWPNGSSTGCRCASTPGSWTCW
jgi:uncharacterized membrane protein YfcA